MMDPNSRPPLATVLKRFAAILLDGILFALVMIPSYAGGFLLFTGATSGGDTLITIGTFLVLFGSVALNGYLALVLGMFAYGLTPGRHFLGVQVVRADTGVPVGFWRMFLRQLAASYISAPICYLGFLWAFFDANRQTWHDKMAKTLVIQTR